MTVNPKALSVTIVLPGLKLLQEPVIRKALQQVSQQLPRLPALELIVSRSERSPLKANELESLLFEVFRLKNLGAGDFPVGALSNYLSTGEINQQWFLRADPVYLQPNRDHLLLLGNDMLDISTQDAEQLIQDINGTYQDTPWQLKMISSKEWVVETDQAISLQTHPLNDVVGKNINEYLPQGKDAAQWHALLNELQMFLHSHPVNQAREMQGLAPANSVWFWGVGQLSDISGQVQEQDYVQCWSNYTTALGLARLCKVPRVDLPDTGDAWLKQVITPGRHLLVIDELGIPAPIMDPGEWWQSLANVEQKWMQPLLSALQSGAIEELDLVGDSGQRQVLTRSMSKHWWKRVKELV